MEPLLTAAPEKSYNGQHLIFVPQGWPLYRSRGSTVYAIIMTFRTKGLTERKIWRSQHTCNDWDIYTKAIDTILFCSVETDQPAIRKMFRLPV